MAGKLSKFRRQKSFIDHRDIPPGSKFTFKVVHEFGQRPDGARLGIEITSGPFKGPRDQGFRERLGVADPII